MHKKVMCDVLNLQAEIPSEQPYRCELCNSSFAEEGSLKDHVCSREKTRVCPHCDFRTAYQTSLTKHVKRAHTKDFKHICSICGQAFLIPSQMKRHIEKHHSNQALNETVISIKKEKDGPDSEHNSEENLTKDFKHVCSICSQAFLLPSQMRKHIKKHHSVQAVKKTVRKIKKEKEGQDSERNSEAKLHRCEFCLKTFPSKPRLTRHLLVHSTERPHICDTCGKTFRLKSRLNHHLETHNPESPHICSTCGKCFKLRTSLMEHCKRSHIGKQSLFTCPLCDRHFKQKISLSTHLFLHTGELPFRCSECGEGFRQRDRLQIHERIHTGDRPFQCSTCGKDFTRKSYLQEHEQTHCEEKPHACPHCEKCFGRKSNLMRHIRMHLGELPHICKTCGKGFSVESRLHLHEGTHLKGKPLLCGVCGRSFKQKRSLDHHELTHTSEPSHCCPHCDYKTYYSNHLKRHIERHHEDNCKV